MSNSSNTIHSRNLMIRWFSRFQQSKKILFKRSRMHLQDFRQIWCPLIWILLPVSTNSKTISNEMYLSNGSTESSVVLTPYPDASYDKLRQDYDYDTEISEGRGMDEDRMDMSEEKAIKNDPWQGYIDFLINEGSFKFWAVFQVVTAAILIYSAFAAVYYAKYNFIQADYDYYDFLGRSSEARSSRLSREAWSGLSAETFQRIFDAISSKKYS